MEKLIMYKIHRKVNNKSFMIFRYNIGSCKLRTIARNRSYVRILIKYFSKYLS